MLHNTGTVIIGGGQAGLSLAYHLTRTRQPHILLERGRAGERWHSERWDSLTLLTPNWLNRLDGCPRHAAPDGFLGRDAFARYLRAYARPLNVREHVSVLAVEQSEPNGGFHVATDAGVWRARNVVVATGDAAEPRVPELAVPAALRQLHSSAYRNPAQLAPGGVLVVGAGPSGQQIAAELRRAGREVVIAVGRHARALRSYRGRDLWWWLEELGDLERPIDEHPDPLAARRTPNLTLTGLNGGEQLDLDVLQRLGVTVTGRLERIDGSRAQFGDPSADVAAAERRLQRLLDRIGARTGEPAEHAPPLRFADPPRTIDLAVRGVATVVWATGYRRSYPWLQVPALGADGEIAHRHGIAQIPGLAVLGLKFQRRRASHFIGRVGADAAFIANWIAARAQFAAA